MQLPPQGKVNSREEPSSREKVDWFAVGFFYFAACAFSWPFFWWRDIHPESWFSWNFPLVPVSSPLTFILKMAIVMWGPGIAAILSLIIFRKTHRRTITFWGTSWSRSLAFYFVPIYSLSLSGCPCLTGA